MKKFLSKAWYWFVVALLFIGMAITLYLQRQQYLRLKLEYKKKEFDRQMETLEDKKAKVLDTIDFDAVEVAKIDDEIKVIREKRSAAIKLLEDLELSEDPEEIAKRVREL